MDESQAKAAFAAFLLDTPEAPFIAAQKVYPENIGMACRIAQEWIVDAEVLAETKRLKEAMGNDESQLPTKVDLANLVWEMASHKGASLDERIKAAKLYAEIRSMIEKPATVSVNTNIVTPTVMVYKDHGSDDEWEKKSQAQQKALTNGKYVAKQLPTTH